MEISGKPGEPVEAVTTAPEVPPEETNEVAPIDYAAELEKEKARREKAEFTLYKKNKAEREAKKAEPVVEEEQDDLIKKQVEENFTALAQAQREKDAEDLVEAEINRRTANPDERKLIRFNYDNKINKSGYSQVAISEDLDDAQFLANKASFMKERKELEHTAISKQTITNSGGGTNLDKAERTEDLSKKFTKYDWEFMKKRNWSKDQIEKAAKELKN